MQDTIIELEYFVSSILMNTVIYEKMEESFRNQYNIIGCFLDRRCVCAGIASGFKYLCDLLGVKAIYVTGDKIENGKKTGAEGHAWNMVCIEEEWYHFDATWNINTQSKLYFNITEDFCYQSHRIDAGL